MCAAYSITNPLEQYRVPWAAADTVLAEKLRARSKFLIIVVGFSVVICDNVEAKRAEINRFKLQKCSS